MQTDSEVKFNILYKKYKTYVKTICRKYTNDSETLNDYVSESFVRIYKNIDKVNLDCCKTYISIITKSSCIDCIRKNKKRKCDVSIDSQYSYDEPYTETPTESDNTGEYVNSLIQTLENPYRDIFIMFVIEGLRHKEIAEKLNMNTNTVRCNYMKARTILASKIMEEKKFTGIEIF